MMVALVCMVKLGQGVHNNSYDMVVSQQIQCVTNWCAGATSCLRDGFATASMPGIFIKRDDINRLGLTSFCAYSPMARAKSNELKNFVDLRTIKPIKRSAKLFWLSWCSLLVNVRNDRSDHYACWERKMTLAIGRFYFC